jgi:hypothetical protein
MSQHLQRSILGAVLALAASLTPSVAAADDAVRLSLDWDKLAVLLHEGPASLLPRETGLSGLGGHAETVDQAHGGVPSTWITPPDVPPPVPPAPVLPLVPEEPAPPPPPK